MEEMRDKEVGKVKCRRSEGNLGEMRGREVCEKRRNVEREVGKLGENRGRQTGERGCKGK